MNKTPVTPLVRLLLLLSLAAALLATATTAAAATIPPPPADYNASAGPITWEQCYEINPTPEYTTCAELKQPTVNFLDTLPYDEPEYVPCVQQRCVCSGATNTSAFTPFGLYCNSSGWMESGYTTCNQLAKCFVHFWKCVNLALMRDRYYANKTLTAAETQAVAAIMAHGTTPGEPFQESDSFLSCRQVTCAAAASRKNCGVLTCHMNYTQCFEYIRPPPRPHVHQICTQGCRATLVLMGMTIIVCTFAVLCCCCCPPAVVVIAPLIDKEAKDAEDAKDHKKKTASEQDRDWEIQDAPEENEVQQQQQQQQQK